MSELDFDPEFIKAEMWRKRGRSGNCAICSMCGGSSSSHCGCARKRFMDKLTEQDICSYVNQKRDQQRQHCIHLIETKKREIELLEQKLQTLS